MNKCEIYKDDTLIYSSNTYEKLIRQEGLEFLSFNFSQAPKNKPFNKILFYSDDILIKEKIYDKDLVFSMRNNEIRLNISGYTVSVGLLYDNEVGMIFDNGVGYTVEIQIEI